MGGERGGLQALNDTSLFWTVDDVFSPEECEELIARAEAEGFQRVGYGAPGNKKRHNARITFFDEALAKRLFDAIRHILPIALIGLSPLCANECLRFYKYVPGDFFRPHQDTDHYVSPTHRSLLSVVVYLNGDCEGGELYLPALEKMLSPRPGLAAVFGHRMVHESKPLISGTKYAFRSDVIYAGGFDQK